MARSSSSDQNRRLGRREDDSNRPRKRPRYSPAIPETTGIINFAGSSTKTNPKEKKPITGINIPESDWWVVTRFLGKGSYGSVYLANKTTTNGDVKVCMPQEMAIKTTEVSQASRLQKEEDFLSRFKNQYVVSCYGGIITQDKESREMLYNAIYEYCSGGCLAKHVERYRGRGLLEYDAKRFAIDILSGLKCIHEKKIIHGDIEPKNILLVPDDVRANGLVATRRFMPPELVVDMVLDYCADVWAFGCTLLEMLTGKAVWGEYGDDIDWEDWISLVGESGSVPYVPGSLSQGAKDFLSKCLVRDPAQRWTVEELLKHPFLVHWTSGISGDEEEEEERYEDVVEEENQEMEEVEVEEEEEEEEEIGVADVEAHEPYQEEEEEDASSSKFSIWRSRSRSIFSKFTLW
ncbi:unnamed protein product [Microthlaspi erraticum]|uniref:Protein kinase domain-containing protein n=1 Tax=Microthlaspi erraticum TaxID=1685480 RepID=A0A6D2HU58_9BRAS|nr:unnamed protein product [Microthlaspi erraticum]